HEVLDSTEGFSLLDQGTLPFTGNVGVQVWNDLSETVSQKWDTVLDAIDGLVTAPDVDEKVLEQTAEELAAFHEESAEAEAGAEGEEDLEAIDAADSDDDEDEEEGPVGFWAEVGIDPIKIITSGAEYYTLRCYLDDAPVFLGSEGEIDVFTSTGALARALADGKDLADTDLADVSTWDEVLAKATAGELEIEVDPENTYVLTGLDADIAEGPESIDPTQLELAVELITDAAEWAGDESVEGALASNESLGWLVSFVLRPDPTRLEPSAPFDAEQSAWRKLVETFENRLTVA
ncbi:primosomal protein, partial [Amycolatopsis sp. NPDC051128]|uniref:primosomal protein n=1 Tax=Amycolatopsis sp. NPDC051128 TaxID=3155412 RepID=UPI003436F86B